MSKLLTAARRKWGPLPVWAWAGIAGTIGALYWRLRGGGSDTGGAAVQDPAIAYGGEADYGDTGSSGVGPVGADASGSGQPTSDDVSAFESRLGVIEAGMKNMGEHFNDPAYWGVDTAAGDGSSTAPEAGTADGGTETVTPDKPADVDPSKPKPKAAGVKWGGRTFTTKQGLASWLSGHGATYSTWVKNHPAAAKLLKGPVPKPKPTPRRAAPRPVSGRATSRQAPKTGAGKAGARPRPQPKPTPKRKPPRPAPVPHGERYVAPKPKTKAKPKPARRGGGGGW